MNPSTELLGAAVLALGTVDPPARGTPVHDLAYPTAFDAGEPLGAVTFATWDPYPGDFGPTRAPCERRARRRAANERAHQAEVGALVE